MKAETKAGIVLAAILLFLFAWAPWITDDYAVSKVAEKLGGQTATFNYLGQNMPAGDIPKDVNWFPFGRFVTFPSEAEWFVTFYGAVVP